MSVERKAQQEPEAVRVAPEEQAGFVSRLLFLWVLPFVRDAWSAVQEKRFTADLLPPIPADEQPQHNILKLRTLWDEERKKGPAASLSLVCLKMMGRALCTCLVIMNLQALLLMSGPLMVGQLVKAIQGTAPPSVGFLMCFLLTATTASASILQQGSWHICSRSARQCWLALSGLIFEKPARLSSMSRSDLTEGELVNMMAVDAQQVLQFMQFFAIFASAPSYILVPTIIIPIFIGWPYIMGLIVFAATSFVSDRVAVKVKTFQGLKLKAADKRNARLNESFQGIRTVKLNGWESLMEQRVEEERKEELIALRKFHILQSAQQAISFGMPTIGVVLTFIIYGAVGSEFEPSDVFLCVGLFEFLTLGTSILPHMFNTLRQLRQNMQRMQKLLSKEDDFQVRDAMGLPTGSVVCSDADFSWAASKVGAVASEPTLACMSLRVEPGEMIAICGRVGCGKTTWAGGLLGLVSRTRGVVAISGKVAYVTQNPQILNDTIKENILFGLEADEQWYQTVLEACCLKEDIKQFMAGDETEIGERGITISGGQKQRIAIARAAYSRADIIVLDDPLSAMDAHIGKLVFDRCLRTLLAGQTRIFFTNQLQFCSHCSTVVMLDEGKIVDSGSYKELTSSSPPGPFALFLESVIGGGSGEDDAAAEAHEEVDAAAESDAAGADGEPEPGNGVGDSRKAILPAAAVKRASASSSKADKLYAAPTPMAKPPGTPSSGRTMSVEKKLQGRIGVKDWMQVARASNAATLGALVLFFSVGAPVVQYGVNLLLAFWTDSLVSNPEAGAFDNPAPSVLYASSALLLGLFLFVRGCLCVVYFLASSRTLHRCMLSTTLRQTMSWFDTTPVGRVLNRFGNDVMFMDIMLPMLFQMWSLLFFRVLVIIVVAGITAPPALLLSVMLLVAARFVYGYYGAIALEVQRVQMIALSPLLASQSSFLQSLDSIRCYDRVDIFVRRFYKMQSNFITTFYWAFTLDRTIQCIFTTLGVAVFFGSVSLLLLVLALYESPLSKLVSPGSSGAILAFCSMLAFQAPVALYMTARVEAMMSAVQRVAEYKDQPTEDSAQEFKDEVPKSWPARGILRLEGVDMRYQPSLPLTLQNVTFGVNPGEKVGIVGRTGSGKSSIILTCFRMVNCCGGQITLDGRDTQRVPLQELRSRLGVIPQDSWLFSGTVRSNLDVYGVYSDEEIWRVLSLVQLAGQAKGWTDGLNHEVKEKGENLSMGTAQLLCLARVLLKRPKLLFMDEATASVDAETDKLVQETIRKDGVLPPDCSIVTVAHRLHTVIDYDRIVVLGEGRVLEDAHPAKLLEDEDGHFNKLVESTGKASSRELRRRSLASLEGALTLTEPSPASPTSSTGASASGSPEQLVHAASWKPPPVEAMPPSPPEVSSESLGQPQLSSTAPQHHRDANGAGPSAGSGAAGRARGGCSGRNGCFVAGSTAKGGPLADGCIMGVGKETARTSRPAELRRPQPRNDKPDGIGCFIGTSTSRGGPSGCYVGLPKLFS